MPDQADSTAKEVIVRRAPTSYTTSHERTSHCLAAQVQAVPLEPLLRYHPRVRDCCHLIFFVLVVGRRCCYSFEGWAWLCLRFCCGGLRSEIRLGGRRASSTDGATSALIKEQRVNTHS